MTKNIRTLINHELMCPRCHGTDLQIQVPMWTVLLPDGADLQDGDQEWDDDNHVECTADDYSPDGNGDGDMDCGWRGTVKDCRVDPYTLMAVLAVNAAPGERQVWGSDKQIKNQNIFYEQMRNYVDASVMKMIERYADRATSEEAIKYAMGMLFHATRHGGGKPDTFQSLVSEAAIRWPQFRDDTEVSGADMVEWFGGWWKRAEALLANEKNNG